jgi:hypothetical protein
MNFLPAGFCFVYRKKSFNTAFGGISADETCSQDLIKFNPAADGAKTFRQR